MAAESSIQTNSLPWQIRQGGKNLSEWIQLQLAKGESNNSSPPPNFEFPPWLGQLLFWGLVTGTTVWLAWLLVQVLDRYLAGRQNQAPPPQIQLIPPIAEQSAAAWLREAKKFEQAGNWREACRAFYMATLQLLHDRAWVPHQPSRTDGEYLQAIQPLPQPRPLQLLIRTHERSLFGGAVLAADNVQRCRQAYEEMTQR